MKPCPFCGSKDIEVIGGSRGRYFVASCLNCGAQSKEVCLKFSAFAAWEEKIALATKDAMVEWEKRV